MSSKYRKSLDKNHKEVCQYLKDHRVWAYDASAVGSGFLDLIVRSFYGTVGFLEVKIEGKDADVQRTQLEFIVSCPVPCGFAKTKEEALEFALDPLAKQITKQQKDRLDAFLVRNLQKTFSVSTIERVLRGEQLHVRKTKKTVDQVS
jgi:hypothetical protein